MRDLLHAPIHILVIVRQFVWIVFTRNSKCHDTVNFIASSSFRWWRRQNFCLIVWITFQPKTRRLIAQHWCSYHPDYRYEVHSLISIDGVYCLVFIVSTLCIIFKSLTYAISHIYMYLYASRWMNTICSPSAMRNWRVCFSLVFFSHDTNTRKKYTYDWIWGLKFAK